MKILLGMGVPMGLQFSITAIGSVILQSSVNTLGSTVVAAFTAGTKVEQFTMAPYDALSNTSATFCGQNLGARRIDRIYKGVRQMITISVLYSILAGAAMILWGDRMVGIFVDAGETAVFPMRTSLSGVLPGSTICRESSPSFAAVCRVWGTAALRCSLA